MAVPLPQGSTASWGSCTSTLLDCPTGAPGTHANQLQRLQAERQRLHSRVRPSVVCGAGIGIGFDTCRLCCSQVAFGAQSFSESPPGLTCQALCAGQEAGCASCTRTQSLKSMSGLTCIHALCVLRIDQGLLVYGFGAGHEVIHAGGHVLAVLPEAATVSIGPFH